MLIIPAHCVMIGRSGGVEQMIYNLVEGLCSIGQPLNLLHSNSDQLVPNFVELLKECRDAELLICGGQLGPRFLSEQRACFHPQVKGDAILFPNYFTPPVIPGRCGRVVTVIHDLQYRHYPQYFSMHKRAWLELAHRLTFFRTDTVVVISEFVRQDVERLFGQSAAAKTVVIPNPVSWDRFGETRSLHPLDGRPYILTVAAQYPHKNIATLIRAFAIVAGRDKDIQLVLAGQIYEKIGGVLSREHDIHGLVESLNLGDRIHITGYVDDDLLGCYYRNAALCAFPSIFEGFGLPPVEALGFGVQTLTTRCGSLPVATMGKATYIQDPLDVKEWAETITQMLEKPEQYEISADTVSLMRTYYAPQRIAQKYSDVLLG